MGLKDQGTRGPGDHGFQGEAPSVQHVSRPLSPLVPQSLSPLSPERVRIVEVGPRDGLQNEPAAVPTDVKLAFIRRLADAGLREIEVTSFVRPDRVPQLADAEAVAAGLDLNGPARYSALVPNERGLARALAAGI